MVVDLGYRFIIPGTSMRAQLLLSQVSIMGATRASFEYVSPHSHVPVFVTGCT